MRPHRGTLILVLGILSLIGCGIFTGIPAWVMGNTELKDIDAGAVDPAGRGLVNAGRILGMISTILFILAIVFFVALMMLGVLGHSFSRQ